LPEENKMDADKRVVTDGDPPADGVRGLKDAIAEEIFIAYKEAAGLYRGNLNPDSREMLLAMQHGFDLILRNLFPLDERLEKAWDEYRAQFFR
jgi:hypothetical protein